jgi:limonene-1,2-epoxide hydrolase
LDESHDGWTACRNGAYRKGIHVTECRFFEIKDRKIVAWTQYYDRMTLLSQMGIISPK